MNSSWNPLKFRSGSRKEEKKRNVYQGLRLECILLDGSQTGQASLEVKPLVSCPGLSGSWRAFLQPLFIKKNNNNLKVEIQAANAKKPGECSHQTRIQIWRVHRQRCDYHGWTVLTKLQRWKRGSTEGRATLSYLEDTMPSSESIWGSRKVTRQGHSKTWPVASNPNSTFALIRVMNMEHNPPSELSCERRNELKMSKGGSCPQPQSQCRL